VATLKEIRNRIQSVKNTRKITKAMKLVAGARLKRAQEMILAARPYAIEIHKVITSLALRAEQVHPLLEVREPKVLQVLCITSDRGLCGAFNANIIRRTEAFLRESRDQYDKISLAVVGRKGHEYFRRRKMVDRFFPDVFFKLELERAREIGRAITQGYVEQNLDEVLIIYNEFKSAISQQVVVERLLPMATPEELAEEGHQVDYIYEPDRRALLDHLIPRYVHATLYRALLESWASEMGARMTAMENATRNAGELIDRLTLERNRARQAAITKELMEIISGAEALKG
jgi:F-type H+-transporting ATPase subunit gamma